MRHQKHPQMMMQWTVFSSLLPRKMCGVGLYDCGQQKLCVRFFLFFSFENERGAILGRNKNGDGRRKKKEKSLAAAIGAKRSRAVHI
jgi:hypothetical protein